MVVLSSSNFSRREAHHELLAYNEKLTTERLRYEEEIETKLREQLFRIKREILLLTFEIERLESKAPAKVSD